MTGPPDLALQNQVALRHQCFKLGRRAVFLDAIRQCIDQLVRRQSKTGHESGSWWTDYHWTAAGGRLYETSLSVMTLEVYYRHLPLYGYKSVEF